MWGCGLPFVKRHPDALVFKVTSLIIQLRCKAPSTPFAIVALFGKKPKLCNVKRSESKRKLMAIAYWLNHLSREGVACRFWSLKCLCVTYETIIITRLERHSSHFIPLSRENRFKTSITSLRKTSPVRLGGESFSTHPQRSAERQWHRCALAPPTPITRCISPSKAHLHKSRGAQGHNGREEPKLRTLRKGKPLPKLTRESLSPRVQAWSPSR